MEKETEMPNLPQGLFGDELPSLEKILRLYITKELLSGNTKDATEMVCRSAFIALIEVSKEAGLGTMFASRLDQRNVEENATYALMNTFVTSVPWLTDETRDKLNALAVKFAEDMEEVVTTTMHKPNNES